MTRPSLAQLVQYAPESALLGHDLLAALITKVDRHTGAVSLLAYLPDGGSIVVHGVQQAKEPTRGFWCHVHETEERKVA